MSLPRFALQEDDDDSTAPAEFLLKLPPSYARKLALLAPSTPGEWMIPAPFPTQEAWPAKSRSAPHRLVAMIAGACVAVAILGGVGGALAQSNEGPVGISKRAPKKFEHVVLTSTRQSGAAAHVPTVSIESLQRHRKRRH
jgi:hypothetical protein